jgi:hypothetical protein
MLVKIPVELQGTPTIGLPRLSVKQYCAPEYKLACPPIVAVKLVHVLALLTVAPREETGLVTFIHL